jgi:hypothetical protein
MAWKQLKVERARGSGSGEKLAGAATALAIIGAWFWLVPVLVVGNGP